MNKEEYKTILKLLNEGKVEEVKSYLDDRMKYNYITLVQKTIMKLINSDCDKKYPSYYQRTELHEGVTKLYRGFYDEIDNGFVICHKGSNAFLLYDRSVLNTKIINMLEESYRFNNEEERKNYTQSLIEIFDSLSEKKLKPIYSTNKLNKNNIVASSSDESTIVIPNEYYIIAHKLLGEDTLEYISGNGMYFNSSKGKALVLGRACE